MFSFLFFANAYNLIDGIDGLAGSVGAMMSLVFGLFFVVFGDFQAAIISFVLLSSLLGFLKHNLSKTRKIFMGDSGSLFVGFLLMLQAIYFLKLDFSTQAAFLPNKLIFVYALFAFPILDTVRVFVLRIANGRSPFSADRNHLHHKLLDLGLSHKKSSAVIVISNITLVVITLLLFKLNVNIQLLIALPLSIVLFYFPFLIKNKSRVTRTKSIS